jgi:hypothetical protein
MGWRRLHRTRFLASWRIRGASALGALGTVLALRSLLPLEHSEQGAYLFVTTFGYGHLLGASFGGRRASARADMHSRLLRGAFVVTSLASLQAAFTGVLAAAPWIVLPMLYASLWHIVENDVAIQGSARAGLSALPFPRSREHHLLAGSLTGLLAALAGRSAQAPAFEGTPAALEVAIYLLLLAPGPLLFAARPRTLRGQTALLAAFLAAWLVWRGAPWLLFWQVFAAVTVYHLIEWLLVVAGDARARCAAGQPGELRRVARRTLALHLPAVALCIAAFAGGDATAWLRGAFAPASYLIFSLAHVAHTTALRIRRTPAEAVA